jgi:ubiquinone/menaquinone biosynthesis C-methylase UbiE
MGLYSRYVLPRLLDFAMKDERMTALRERVVPRARGVTLELGIGSGLNLRFYSAQVTKLFGVDPSAELQKVARTRVPARLPGVEWITQSASDPLPLAERSVDTAVVTWSLCSMSDPVGALRQVRRVLRPEGELLFVEHGLSPDPSVARWQGRLNPLWRPLAGGCNMNRKVDALLGAAGFAIAELENFYLTGPRVLTYTYRGVAR